MASTYHSFDRYRSTTNSYIEKQTACGMIWLGHIIVGMIWLRHIIVGMIWLRHIIVFDTYRSTTNSYVEKLTACGMIWLRHIIVLIGIDGQQIRMLKSKQPMA